MLSWQESPQEMLHLRVIVSFVIDKISMRNIIHTCMYYIQYTCILYSVKCTVEELKGVELRLCHFDLIV